jgi:hypothetical protein
VASLPPGSRGAMRLCVNRRSFRHRNGDGCRRAVRLRRSKIASPMAFAEKRQGLGQPQTRSRRRIASRFWCSVNFGLRPSLTPRALARVRPYRRLVREPSEWTTPPRGRVGPSAQPRPRSSSRTRPHSLPVPRGTESLLTHRWRGESRANQSLKWVFRGLGNYRPIPRRLWMMSEV